MAVASRDGGNLVKVASLRPANSGRKPFFKEFLSVDMAGEKSAACANSTRLAGVLVAMALFKLMVATASGVLVAMVLFEQR